MCDRIKNNSAFPSPPLIDNSRLKLDSTELTEYHRQLDLADVDRSKDLAYLRRLENHVWKAFIGGVVFGALLLWLWMTLHNAR
jgi:hypothetical protein